MESNIQDYERAYCACTTQTKKEGIFFWNVVVEFGVLASILNDRAQGNKIQQEHETSADTSSQH